MTTRSAPILKNSLTIVSAAITITCAPNALAEPLPAPGALLRQGEWIGIDGSFLAPAAFASLPARQWPLDGWAVWMLDRQNATLTIHPLSRVEAHERFKPITAEVAMTQTLEVYDTPLPAAPPEHAAELYARVPGLNWQARSVPIHRFKNGTTGLVPEPGYRYQMTLNDKPYAFTVQNGFRAADGRPYGEGTQFSLEMGGKRFDYDLGGHGWEVELHALGDFDGDGKPDFLFRIGGACQSHDALILSSLAKSGKNPPTAFLTLATCRQSPMATDLFSKTTTRLPTEVKMLVGRIEWCYYLAGEFDGNGKSPRTAQLNKMYEVSRCDDVAQALAQMKRKYAHSDAVLQALAWDGSDTE